MNQVPKLTLHHAGLSVTDLDQATKWYAEVLGMTKGFEFEIPPANVRGCFVTRDGLNIELICRQGSAPGIGGQDPPTALLTHGYGHIAFTTQDLDATFASLVARGATPVWDPRPSPQEGVRMAFIADIDGNLIEVMEAVPGKTTAE
jgi:lactoylglutathione lyase